MKTIRDTWLIFHRSLILTLRQPTWVVFGMMLPVLYLVLFGPLLEGAVKEAGSRHERVQLVRARADHPDRDLRHGIRRLRAHRRAAQRRRRAHARDTDEPGLDAARPVAPGRRRPDVPGADHDPAGHPVRARDPAGEHRGRPRPARADRAVGRPAVVRRRAAAQERGRVRAGGQRDRRCPCCSCPGSSCRWRWRRTGSSS